MTYRTTFLLGAALSSMVLAGCQSPQNEEPQQAGDHTMRTPDGDKIDGPIPGNHWPFTIQRGGGGGTSR